MSKVLEDAIKAYAVDVLEQIAAARSDPFIVPESHRAAVVERLEQAERGQFASDKEMAVLWKKCGL